ncbi:hypothetical protein BKA58DRAFT_450916 [Alternaria rosae]|uniref:uncharacterized protein n=1 Tax=Alternaria rosae TaxID=1187941 RepID=UPI001E8CB557|nr:uncharacterized protein BKA58DRAFT_450916 [Alternaria rosae]KAH6848489.1 hypothetical protein BKA58DRAFT_450916 [Alternaria rosae]
MQFFITILSLAVAVSAVPQGNGNGNVICKGGNEKAVCCSSEGLLGAAQCITLPISVQQAGCDGSIRCCDTDAEEHHRSRSNNDRSPAIPTNLQTCTSKPLQLVNIDEGFASGSDISRLFLTRNRQLRGSLRDVRAIESIRGTPILPGTIDAAVAHLIIAIRGAKLQAEDALGTAIAALKNLNITTLMKGAMEWIKLCRWETAALVVPVVLMACTSAFLGLVGFTAGGVAPGSLAAWIQASIGNVAAGSVFATLTSAAMAGDGTPIVLRGVWGVSSVSSVLCWVSAAWKKWTKDSGDADHTEQGKSHTKGEGIETARRNCDRLLD